MDNQSQSKKELTLLGIWNITPVGVWTWFNDIAVGELKRLTGRDLDTFCYLKDDLNYECFTKESTDQLKADLDTLSSQAQQVYVQKITDDYYALVKPLEEQLKTAESSDVAALSNEELASHIEKLAEVWSKVTMQIWYAVLLDIWYPLPEDKATIKSIIAKARDHCGHLHAQSDKVEHELYIEAAKRLSLSEREVYFMIQPEIVDALRGKNLISKDILASRTELWVESNHTGKLETYEGEKAKEVLDLFNVPKVGPKKEGVLKGTPASLGNVTGKARVILLDREFPEFQEGEILVSLQTMVHYLPIMKKAAAILTEFGGLTSHAAIVSRELKKPAIVGISGLISTVKTGDVLEVDAKAGTVKIL